MMSQQINVDDRIIKLMSEGKTQKEVSQELKKLGITPNSISMIEKKLKAMRSEHNANTNVHLFLILSRKGFF